MFFNSFFSGMSPKTSFLIGIAGAIGTISFIGFIILSFAFAFNKDSEGSTTRVAGTNTDTDNGSAAPAMGGHDGGGAADVRVRAVSDSDHVLGDRNAKISIVEFSDFECPFCSRLHPTLERIVSEYDGEVNWVYRHFPLSSIHNNAEDAAIASECAAEQGKFWEYAKELFNSQTSLSRNTYISIASNVGLNGGKFESCLDSDKYDGKVSDNLNEATEAGGRGTPYSVILTKDGQSIPISGAVPYEQFQGVIQGLL